MSAPVASFDRGGAGPVAGHETVAAEPEPPPGLPPPVLSVEIVDDDGDWPELGDLAPAILRAVEAMGSRPEIRDALPASACVALSSDAAVRRLNAQFRGKDASTNVLSFPAPALARAPMRAGPSRPVFLGDVVLAAGTVAREAAALGIPVAHHVQHLVVHGLLHLLGYEHERDADAAAMEALETDILAGLGVADPYAALE